MVRDRAGRWEEGAGGAQAQETMIALPEPLTDSPGSLGYPFCGLSPSPMLPTGESVWHPVSSGIPDCYYNVTHLPVGVTVRFRVACANRAGQGPFSNPSEKVIVRGTQGQWDEVGGWPENRGAPEHPGLAVGYQGDDFLCFHLDSSVPPSAAHQDAPVTSGPARAPPPHSPTSLAQSPTPAPAPAPAPPAPQPAALSPSSPPTPPSQALSSLKAVGPPPQTPPRKHRGLQPAQQAEPTPPSAQATPSEPKSSAPDTGTPTPASTPQGVKPASSPTPLYMVTSFVSAPPAPEPPGPEPPPEPTKVTVRSLSPAREAVSSPVGGPPSTSGPEGTTLRQGPPQKPYTFLEEKARQVGPGAGREWDAGNRGMQREDQTALDRAGEGLRSGCLALLSSNLLCRHRAKLFNRVRSFTLYNSEREKEMALLPSPISQTGKPRLERLWDWPELQSQ